MYLKSVKVKNFRSFWSDDPKPTVDIELARGVNYFAGQNNSGKSNLLRALALALGDDKLSLYDPEIDRPKEKRVDTQSTVTLEFAWDGQPKSSPERTLLKYVGAYEETVADFKAPSLASQRRVQLYVQAGKNQRARLFLASGTGPRRGDSLKLDAAMEQFRDVIRFVDIRSGEDLESLLKRRFKEVLGNVIAEEHNAKVDAARKAREAYVASLTDLLLPLAEHVGSHIKRYVKDIQGIRLMPSVAQVEDAIAGAEFVVRDAVETALEHKGTGVRGATLMMLLSFIADSSRRAVVFAIEEPESFLHPEAHRELGIGLEDFAKRPDVTVLVTTHSPFIFRDDGTSNGKLFSVTKSGNGHSEVVAEASVKARTNLIGSKVLAEYMRRADELKSDDTVLVLVTEGTTDRAYLRIAMKLLGLDIPGLAIAPAEGALDAAFQAATLRGLNAGDRVISAVFDDDDEGRRAADFLLKNNWQKRSQVMSYAQWVEPRNVPVEAEDMFSNAMVERFLSEVGEAGHLDGKNLRPKSGGWHYSFTEAGKNKLVEWAGTHAAAPDVDAWRAMLEHLRLLIEKEQLRRAKTPVQQIPSVALAVPRNGSTAPEQGP